MKVLLIDDSATMRTIQNRCLGKVGIVDITEASDGVIALEKFHQDSFDFILTDWNMPNMNGLEFLIEIRKIDQKIPVIMVTTEAEQERVIAAVKAGVTDYIIKPFTHDTLLEKIVKWTTVPA